MSRIRRMSIELEVAKLTKRERQILALVGKKLDNRKIAQELNLSTRLRAALSKLSKLMLIIYITNLASYHVKK